MAKYLLTTWPFAGHIHPNLAIAYALAARGHEVAFYTGSRASALVREEGFSHFPFVHVNDSHVEWLVTSPQGIISQPRNPLRRKAMWREWVLDTVPAQLADLDEILAQWSPDMIVCDPSMWGPYLILREMRWIPVAIFSLVAACLLSGRDSPVLGMPMPRPRSRVARLRTSLVRYGFGLFLADVRRAANGLRRSYGLSPIRGSVTDFAGQMDLYLVPSSPEFDYQRTDLPPSVHYVGPCLWSKSASQTPTWLAQLDEGPPVVYVTEGTIHLRPHVLAAAAQGLGNRPLHVVMTTGRHRHPDELDLGPRPLAPNIQVEQWVPMVDLLPHLDVVVTTGGPSTVLAALQQGLPLVIVPSDWDHPETGWRVADTGAGIVLKPDECTPEQLRNAVERVLSEPTYRQNARRLAASFARCGGPSRAAQLLDEALAQHAATIGAVRPSTEPV